MLTVNDLYFQRGDREFFHGLSFALKKGDVLQITGPNGVGKTTLLRLLAGLTLSHHGTIQRHSPCAYVGHRPGFTPWLTVTENLQFTLRLQGKSEKNIDDILQQFTLENCQHLFPAQLSAGQQQRLAFAQLILTRADIWLLDEPSAALDQQALTLLQSLVLAHIASQGTVVLTTHQLLRWPVTMKQLQLQANTCGTWV